MLVAIIYFTPFQSQLQKGAIHFYAKTYNFPNLRLQIYLRPSIYVSLILLPYPRWHFSLKLKWLKNSPKANELSMRGSRYCSIIWYSTHVLVRKHICALTTANDIMLPKHLKPLSRACRLLGFIDYLLEITKENSEWQRQYIPFDSMDCFTENSEIVSPKTFILFCSCILTL